MLNFFRLLIFSQSIQRLVRLVLFKSTAAYQVDKTLGLIYTYRYESYGTLDPELGWITHWARRSGVSSGVSLCVKSIHFLSVPCTADSDKGPSGCKKFEPMLPEIPWSFPSSGSVGKWGVLVLSFLAIACTSNGRYPPGLCNFGVLFETHFDMLSF